jgi:single-stranded-DNA-specific exonuclease
MSTNSLLWELKSSPEHSQVQQNCDELNIPSILAAILAQRNIVGFDAAKKYFRPNTKQLHSPFLMKGMDIAANRLVEAIDKGEKILVYGDYDVDGTTSVALMYSYLKTFTDNIDYYIPDRYKEGYGVSDTAMHWANEHQFQLIITLDCGIKANKQVDLANSYGIDVIICDHHQPGNVLPAAIAVLDPKQVDCPYPYKELSGCGVGYKLLCAYAELTDQPDHQLIEYTDLLAISIAADIVPITGENRVLCSLGLQQLNTSPRLGLKTLLAGRKKNKALIVTDLVFFIAPRINAAGRIKSGKHAVALMIEGDEAFAKELAVNIENNNSERKDLDQSITQEALEMVEEMNENTTLASTVVYQNNWHKGVVGIVASRLIEQHYKPTIVLTESEGKICGSARSVDGFDVYEAIEACEKHLIQFGGHKYAAGLTMTMEQLPTFKEAFEQQVSNTILEAQKTPRLVIDQELTLEEITTKFFRILSQMEPFGPMNLTPMFVCKNVKGMYTKLVGENHLKLTITNDSGIRINAIGFGLGNWETTIKNQEHIDIAFVIDENEWQGNVSLQLVIKDIKHSKQ